MNYVWSKSRGLENPSKIPLQETATKSASLGQNVHFSEGDGQETVSSSLGFKSVRKTFAVILGWLSFAYLPLI